MTVQIKQPSTIVFRVRERVEEREREIDASVCGGEPHMKCAHSAVTGVLMSVLWPLRNLNQLVKQGMHFAGRYAGKHTHECATLRRIKRKRKAVERQ